MNLYQLLYSPDKLLEKLIIKVEKQLEIKTKSGQILYIHKKEKEMFLVFLNILSQMRHNYISRNHFELQFAIDMKLSKKRNPSNMRQYEKFFSINETFFQLIIPLGSDSDSDEPNWTSLEDIEF
ncbi:MAG: hypothetical protein JXR95_14015 [Deltaproteobacteria bacterium]|nr:hypothetical protein [Deltaproteobacteria bacterium]